MTDRKVGESFRHLFYQVLRSGKFRNDYLSNYKITTPNGKIIKSTTALIRDDDGVTVGAFCINFDIGDLLKSNSFLDEFLRIDEEDPSQEESEIVDNVWNVVTDMIRHAVNEYPVSIEEMTKADKIKIVSFLNEKGLFLIKGAIDHIRVSGRS
ncbi:PAS domain-containing protein [Effusibacillus dendaii]|uniref:YheO-like domain-containing protein n=1 Tax=Effusibacillus dendaii TaxID=2743772 RepID=A0A7I8D5X0_9BACL|nr:PAS domain-containing protein [Effusibacillus dendaii]BCJ85543.1 hypothetical protein skT53_05280 [Effusibacillus dendaii]